METPASIFAYLLFGLKNKEWIENGQKNSWICYRRTIRGVEIYIYGKIIQTHRESVVFFTKTTSQNQRKCLIMSVMVKLGE